MAIYTMEQYQALIEAIAEGVLEVQYADKKVRYRSLSDMLQVKKLMEDDLGLTKAGSNRRVGVFSKGLY